MNAEAQRFLEALPRKRSSCETRLEASFKSEPEAAVSFHGLLQMVEFPERLKAIPFTKKSKTYAT